MTLMEYINIEIRDLTSHIKNLLKQDIESNFKHTKSYQKEITYWQGALKELYEIGNLVAQGDIKEIKKEVAQ